MLKNIPYDQKADLWSIGIITYLLLSGVLPFDDENDNKAIARKTVFEKTPFYPSLWNHISNEGKDFVDKLLQKEPEDRMKIQEIFEHPWMKKFYKKKDSKHKSSSAKDIDYLLFNSFKDI